VSPGKEGGFPSVGNWRLPVGHFQPTLHLSKKFRRFYENTVTGCQELLKTYVNSNGITMRCWIRNADITLNIDSGVPSIGLPNDADLFNYKILWNWAMQIDWDKSNFWKFDVASPSYRRFLELRKQQRLELSKLFESWKPKSAFLEGLPSIMQPTNSSLQYLRRCFSKPSENSSLLWAKRLAALDNLETVGSDMEVVVR